MPRLTKKEKVAQFYHNLTKLNKAMQQYEDFLAQSTLYRNRHRIADKNEMGKIAEERKEEMELLNKALEKTDALADDQMTLACEAFDMLRKLLD